MCITKYNKKSGKLKVSNAQNKHIRIEDWIKISEKKIDTIGWLPECKLESWDIQSWKADTYQVNVSRSNRAKCLGGINMGTKRYLENKLIRNQRFWWRQF